jgi:hypothetical protein
MRVHRKSYGFSLIELMLAMVAGLIVIGAVLAFTLSSLRANSSYIRSTRLTQELRTNLGFVSDELRRAGYDEDSIGYIFQPKSHASSQFSPIGIANAGTASGCVVYAYDRLPGIAGSREPANGEIRALRRVDRSVNGQTVGVLEFAESSAANPGVTCSGGSPDYSTYPATCNGNWCAVSDPRVLDITTFTLTTQAAADMNIPGNASTKAMQIRRFGVDMRGRLIGDPDVVRGVHANVRVRADCVQDNPGSFTSGTFANCAADGTQPLP